MISFANDKYFSRFGLVSSFFFIFHKILSSKIRSALVCHFLIYLPKASLLLRRDFFFPIISSNYVVQTPESILF